MPKTQDAIHEPVFTADEVAERLKLHPATIRRIFIHEPGVIRLGHAGNFGKKQYYSLRIPASVVHRVVSRMRVPSPLPSDGGTMAVAGGGAFGHV